MNVLNTEKFKEAYKGAKRAGRLVKRFTNEIVEIAEDAIFYSKSSEIAQEAFQIYMDKASHSCDSQLSLLKEKLMPRNMVPKMILIDVPANRATFDSSSDESTDDYHSDEGDHVEGLGLEEINYNDIRETTLYGLIENKEWDKVVDRLKQNPEEASTWIVRYDRYDPSKVLWRMLPLHAVCYPVTTFDSDGNSIYCGIRAKIRVITELLRIFPSAARMKDDRGSIPLHLASRNGAPLNVIKLLLDTYPRGVEVKDDKDRTPYEFLERSNTLNKERILAILKEFSYKQRAWKDSKENYALHWNY